MKTRSDGPGRATRFPAGASHRTIAWPLLVVLLLLALPAERLHGEVETPDSLLRRGFGAYERGDFDECAELLLRYIENGGRTANNYYFAACCLARAGDRDRACRCLDQAINLGLKDLPDLDADPDLSALRDDARWPALSARYRERREAYLRTLNPDLIRMYEEDQAERTAPPESVDWAKAAPREVERRQATLALVQAGGLKAADDYFHAAAILQHGGDSTSYRLAHELALECSRRDSTHAACRWLAAAARDRYLHSTGRPQIYGTQFRYVNGLWTLEPIDSTAVNDVERARWHVPSLRTSQRRVEEMNREIGATPRRRR